MPSFKKPILVLVLIFILIEWIGREHLYAMQKIGLTWKRGFRWMMYYCILIIILLSWIDVKEQQFIYFQF